MTRLNLKRLPAAALTLALALVGGCNRSHTTAAPIADALKADADAGKLPAMRWPDFSDYKPLVSSFYSARNWQTAWLAGGKPTRQASGLIALFEQSAAKGLRPDDYDSARWAGRVQSLGSDKAQADFDLEMTVAAMRYISNLHIGRVNPQHFAFGVDVNAKKYDLPQFLAQQVVGASNVADALKNIEPQNEEYRQTLQALAHYQDLAKQQAADPSLAAPVSAGTDPSALGKRLALEGDADLKSFQVRHGLTNDGKLNALTLAALNVPMSERVEQLEDSLERWRWLSDEYQNAAIEVNIPEFALRTFGPDHKLAFMMNVVVGQALKEEHKTPVLTKEMKYLIFRPFWNVPTDIVKKEIVRHIEASKGYMDAHRFEVVSRSGEPVKGWTAAELEQGHYMVREEPGPKNSLGLVKFMFPNKYDVYLHSTPAPELFSRSRRDFSHGCIRIADPEKLAAWVLRDQPEWTPDAIHDAMENGQDNKTVDLKKPLPVLLFYATAIVDDQGKVRFFDDIYGYDKDMDDVLEKGPPYPVAPEEKPQAEDTE
jgi:murein L,D-transpeptidase YcbB/YkuD